MPEFSYGHCDPLYQIWPRHLDVNVGNILQRLGLVSLDFVVNLLATGLPKSPWLAVLQNL